MAAQATEQLLQVGQGNLLALADAGERHRSVVLAKCDVDHRRDREAPFSRQSHREYHKNINLLQRRTPKRLRKPLIHNRAPPDRPTHARCLSAFVGIVQIPN
jgi:hypothetical protein